MKRMPGQLKTVELEYLESLVRNSVFGQRPFEVDGPRLFVYLYGKELEVTNLRFGPLVWTMVFRLANIKRMR